jgi:hypothetical protein
MSWGTRLVYIAGICIWIYKLILRVKLSCEVQKGRAPASAKLGLGRHVIVNCHGVKILRENPKEAFLLVVQSLKYSKLSILAN